MLYIGVTSNTPMGDWISIVLLIGVGLILIYLELIFVPGTTVLGVVGLILSGIGIYIAYEKHGATTGSMVLAGTALVSIIALVYSFRQKSWSRFSLKTENKSKFNEGYSLGLTIEMRGTAISDLKPIGKAEFGDKTYEVASHGEHIGAGSEVKISKIAGNKIIVDLITN